MKILIATTKRPQDMEGATRLFGMIREEVERLSPGCTIRSFYWTTGKGCYNLVMDFSGPDSEAAQLADAVTLAMMPARWTTTEDDMPVIDTCDLFESNAED